MISDLSGFSVFSCLRHCLVFCLGVAGAADLAAQPLSAAHSTPSQLVDALNSIFGSRSQTRANHARGTVLQGVFTPAPSAAAVTEAVHFQATQVPVTVRFSNNGGNPDIGDADPGAAPYGMAVKFHLPDRSETDLVCHSFNGFPARTADEFREFLIAVGKSPAGSVHPTALETYALRNEAAKSFLNTPKPQPVSFASQPYFSVNTFKFTNAAGKVSYGRYRFLPTEGVRYLGAEPSATAPADYLRTEIRERLAHGPVRMKLMLQIAAPGDRLDDPTLAWPETRPLVELGTLTIDSARADRAAAEDDLVFLPGDLPAGIEVQDPMLTARTKAYAEGFDRRQK